MKSYCPSKRVKIDLICVQAAAEESLSVPVYNIGKIFISPTDKYNDNLHLITGKRKTSFCRNVSKAFLKLQDSFY